jgi:CPA1 family monovalent cation:H+ antiporter
MGMLTMRVARWTAGTMSARIAEFGFTYGVWIIADHLELSPILAVVAFAMTIARWAPARQAARDRIHSYSVWAAATFVLNVLAFLLMGLQARLILSHMHGPALWEALRFAGLVLVIIILVRLAWVMTYGIVFRYLAARFPETFRGVVIPTRRMGLVISWCGMRGLVTLGTAFALPADFPGRDLIVLSAFGVVLGTLVLQGMTLVPLIRLLKIPVDRSLDHELSVGRTVMIRAALKSLAREKGPAAEALRREYDAQNETARNEDDPQAETTYDRLRRKAVAAQRVSLIGLRDQGVIAEDAFQRLEEELDWWELAATPPDGLALDQS